MSKKLWLLFLFVLIFSFLYPPPIALESAKRDKNLPQLTDVSSYQLGMTEFVLKLSGKNLARPIIDTLDNSLEITLPGAQAKNIKKINMLMSNFHQEVPSIANFKAENISDDEGQRVFINLEAIKNIESAVASLNYEGWSLRIKLDEEKNNFVKFEPTPPTVRQPESFLPFKWDHEIITEFRDADLQDVFRLVMAESGKNIIIDSSFPKDIILSMTLTGINAGELINYLMNQYDLACYPAGKDTIAFGTRDSLSKLSGRREVKSFKIAYADLAQLGTMLKNLVSLTDNEYTQDDRMKTIHIKTNPAKMREVEEAIMRLDVPARQVMIRASIFEFIDSATSDVQIALNAVYDKWTFTSNPKEGTGLISFIDQTYSQGRSAFDRYITTTLQALENKGKGRTVANPSVIAVDGQEATISLKQDILYSKGINEKGNVEWGSEEVGPELKFTPRIEENGYVYLDINITTGDYLGKDTDGNIQTSTREVTTKIRVRDGMPFVIGGLNQDGHIITEARIPVLGNIPLLGELFKYKSNEHNKTQAVMIVTPYIIN